MALKKGPFIALDATFPADDHIVAAGERAGWLYLNMACESRLRRGDGIVKEHRMPLLGVRDWRPRLDRLMAEGLVQETPNGLYLPGYLKWNKSEHAYVKRSMEGVAGACDRHHQDCVREQCIEARDWLRAHGYRDG